MKSRRDFIKKAGLGSLALPFLGTDAFAGIKTSFQPAPAICYFTKHLQFLDFEDLAIALEEAGFDGADLTIRKNGHIEPENAAKELPKAVAALQKRKLSVPMAVTNISTAEDKGLDEFLKVLTDNGVQYYRMGYYKFDYTVSLEENIEIFNGKLKRLADKNAKYGIHGGYQNHAGDNFGASIWDLLLALKGVDPQYLGSQFDVRHATFEGGRSWKNDFWAISKHVKTTAVKDFHWEKDQKGKWKNKNTLMGHGMVDFDTYFKMYKELGINGPISNHSEYTLLNEEEKKLSKSEKMKIAIGKLRQDVAFTKRFLQKG